MQKHRLANVLRIWACAGVFAVVMALSFIQPAHAQDPYRELTVERREQYRDNPYRYIRRHADELHVHNGREVYRNPDGLHARVRGGLYAQRDQSDVGRGHCVANESTGRCGYYYVTIGTQYRWSADQNRWIRQSDPRRIRYATFHTDQGTRVLRVDEDGIPHADACLPRPRRQMNITFDEVEGMTKEQVRKYIQAKRMEFFGESRDAGYRGTAYCE